MSAAAWLGQQYRRLGSLTNARTVRADDVKRAELRADLGMIAVRAAQIEKEATKVADELGL